MATTSGGGDRQAQRVTREAVALAAAELMVYPNLGHETYCMAALEAQAVGCVVVCRDFSGLSTTVADGCGIKLPGAAIDEDWRGRAVAAVLDLLADRERMQAMSRRAMEWARPQTWAARVKDEWAPRMLRREADAIGHR
jgi:glycosyltransferase involved in cell wall biosynthesis